MSDDDKILDYLKQVTVELHDVRSRLTQSEERHREPIAIVGMGLSLSGWGVIVGGSVEIGG